MRRALLLVAVASALGCRSGERREVEAAVRVYLDRMAAAYRTSDASLVDPLVSEQQGLKLTGLIGVKRDAGVVLDAKLISLEFTRAEQRGGEWIVETRERWYYEDRRIGSGERVGEDSTDSYEMRYRFARRGGRFVLMDLEFAAPPVVQRKVAPIPVDPRIVHGLGDDSAALPAGPTTKPAR